MHSCIYQISNTPLVPEDYAGPSCYYDNSGDFADYIGDEFKGDDRLERIRNFGDIISPVFESKGDGVFAYKGKEAMLAFKQQWLDAIRKAAGELTADGLLRGLDLFRLRQMTELTHLGVHSRVDISDWADGVANPFAELFEYADSQLEKGDMLYVGAVIDYHW